MEIRAEHDRSLAALKLLNPALQINVCAGGFSTPAAGALPLWVDWLRM